MFRRLAPILAAVLVLAAPAARAQDAGEFVVRLNRLENQMRQMSGQIEQLQFENRQLRDQLRKFQEDTEFRFQEGRGAGRPAAQTPSSPQGATPGSGQTPASGAQRPPRRGDAFDPSATPGAPGAPQQLGQAQPSAPVQAPGPVALPGAVAGALDDDDAGAGPRPLDLGGVARTPGQPRPPAAGQPGGPPSVAASGTGNPRADYDAAYAYLLQKQFEQAEMGFRQFIQSHPRDRLVPDATFWLGESYLQRNRHREAAEQFLKISTQFPNATKGPDAMLKLGVSLNALGARDQACATYAELERKYPQAAPNIRSGVEREQKRARCPS